MRNKRFIALVLIICLIFPIIVFAETVVLKSGKTVEGKLIEKTDKYIKIDFQGVPLTYFSDEIESVDRVNIDGTEKRVNIQPTIFKAGINLRATGYDWVKYSQDEKLKFIEGLFAISRLDKSEYSIEKGVELLDAYYHAAHKKAQGGPDSNEDKFFSVPCIIAFGNFRGVKKVLLSKESEWGIEALRESAKNESPVEVDWEKIDTKLYNDLKKGSGKDDAEIYQAMADSYLKYENLDRARRYFKKAVELNPKLYESWYNLGIFNSNNDEGKEYLKKAIEVNPDYPPSYFLLAQAYWMNRRCKEAIPLLEKYLELAKEDPNEISLTRVAKKNLEEMRSGKNCRD